MARSWLPRQSIDDEVAEELAFHLEMRAREYEARGLDPAAARRAALARFGDVEKVRAACRNLGKKRETDMKRREVLTELRQDALFALRQLAGSPGFALVAVLTLALGIGATTAIFSAVHAVVLRPLPVPRPERLVVVEEFLQGNSSNMSAGNYTDMAAEQRSFARLAAAQFSSFSLSEGREAERTIGARVTASFFDVFGVRPEVGRVFGAGEDQPGREKVVVLSHRLWARRFGADREVVGREIRMNGEPYTVSGVMPARFDFNQGSEELWVPIAFTPERKAMHDEHYLTILARLRDGVGREQALADLAGIAQGLQKRFPLEDARLGFRVEPFMEQFVGDYRARLLVLLGAVGLVLLIACGNVANLLLARGTARGGELAIRASLGAGQGRIVRQLLTESAVLALVASAAGLALAWGGLRALVRLAPPGVPRLEQAALDSTAVAFALAIALVSALVFGLAPALRAARGGVGAVLREGGRGTVAAGARDWLRPVLIAAEVALSVLLLVGAGLLIRSALELQRVRPGFAPQGVISARVSLPEARYGEQTLVEDTFSRLAEEAARLPGVTHAAVSSHLPMSPGGGNNGLIAEGKPLSLESAVPAALSIVTPDFFRTLGVPIVRGRGFDASDRRGVQKVMIVSEAAAAALFPGQDPIGRRVACCEAESGGQSPLYKVVVGVAGDVRSRGLAEDATPEFYLPLEQAPAESWGWVQRTVYVAARTDRDPESLVPGLRRLVAEIDPDVPLYGIATLEQRMADTLATARFNTLLLALLGAIGLVLAAVGIYGVVGYFVAQRTSEIGVRMALGATPRHVLRMVLRQATGPVAAGVVVGLAASVAATRVLAASLVGVEPTDPLTLAVVVVALAGTALVASALPARRAAGLDPKQALQAD